MTIASAAQLLAILRDGGNQARRAGLLLAVEDDAHVPGRAERRTRSARQSRRRSPRSAPCRRMPSARRAATRGRTASARAHRNIGAAAIDSRRPQHRREGIRLLPRLGDRPADRRSGCRAGASASPRARRARRRRAGCRPVSSSSALKPRAASMPRRCSAFRRMLARSDGDVGDRQQVDELLDDLRLVRRHPGADRGAQVASSLRARRRGRQQQEKRRDQWGQIVNRELLHFPNKTDRAVQDSRPDPRRPRNSRFTV